ncbi:MAG: hypothetical protein HY779_00650, partial [Rubrobacteridae bacterium]|nr:hypothetical protein [Rubrobacteridae bacterium]
PIEILVEKLWGYLDLESDTIIGNAPADQDVLVNAWAYDGSSIYEQAETTVTADGSGDFAAGFEGEVDFEKEIVEGQVTYTNDGGNQIIFSINPAQAFAYSENATGDIVADEDVIYAFGFPGETTATITSGESTAAVTSSPEGKFTLEPGAFNPTVDFMGGELVTIAHKHGEYSFNVIDKTAPETQIDVDPPNPDGDNGWYKSVPEISIYSDDAMSVTYYQWDTTNDDGWLSLDTSSIPAPEGVHTINYFSIDADGNTETVKSTQIKDDTQAPVVSDVADATIIKGTQKLLEWHTTESNPGTYTVYKGETQVEQGSFTDDETITVQVGTNTLGTFTYRIVASDMAGNSSSDEARVTVKKEDTPPNTTISAPGNGQTI